MQLIDYLDAVWKDILEQEDCTNLLKNIDSKLYEEIHKHKVFPALESIFKTFNVVALNDIKVVILGQDPYHGDYQANGLCFSVPNGMTLPPSLKNIYKEINFNMGCSMNEKNGDLTPWAQQGVFLLNTILTVRAHQPASHKNMGWELFTDKIISILSERCNNLIFLLWGSFAQSKKNLIDTHKHTVLETTHPSPLSSYRGFLGSNHFSKTNTILEKQGQEPINWQIL